MFSEASGKILTREVRTTFMAEVAVIVNARPIIPVSSYAEFPEILSSSMLLTQKKCHETEPLGDLNTEDLYRIQWKRVQALADIFWKSWRMEYLTSLQQRCKWQVDCPNIQQVDIVRMKEKDVRRNEWTMGIVIRAFPSSDGKVRKVEIRVTKDGKLALVTRPTTDMVRLLSS